MNAIIPGLSLGMWIIQNDIAANAEKNVIQHRMEVRFAKPVFKLLDISFLKIIDIF